jgi:hypothetical protein
MPARCASLVASACACAVAAMKAISASLIDACFAYFNKIWGIPCK